MEQQIARIALSGVPYSADKLYSYLVPPELADACRAGRSRECTVWPRQPPH